MKLSDIFPVVEHGTANPLVALVGSADMHLSQLKGMEGASGVEAASLANQLENFAQLLGSADHQNVPDPKLRRHLVAGTASALAHVRSAIAAAKRGHVSGALHALNAARGTLARHARLPLAPSPEDAERHFGIRKAG